MDLLSFETVSKLMETEGLLVGAIISIISLIAMVAGLLGRSKWKSLAEDAKIKVEQTHKELVQISQVTSAIILGVEEARNGIPVKLKSRITDGIMKVTMERGIEDIVNPIVKGVKEAETVLTDIHKFLQK